MADIELVIKIPEEAKIAFDCAESNDLKGCYYDHGGVIGNAIKNGTLLPEHHGDLKDIGNMELLNVQVHDDYSKGWHNAIEYCVRQLRERTTVIPATKEGE